MKGLKSILKQLFHKILLKTSPTYRKSNRILQHNKILEYKVNYLLQQNYDLEGRLQQHRHDLENRLQQQSYDLEGKLQQQSHDLEGRLQQQSQELEGRLQQQNQDLVALVSTLKEQVNAIQNSNNVLEQRALHLENSTNLTNEILLKSLSNLQIELIEKTKNKPYVSVIIPVYNVEKYLDKCLNSIVNQTLKNIEIIIVNDCSPDNSEDIILKYKNVDERIVYIKHDKNRGQGGARNNGIKIAKSDYVMFVDSDDWLELNTCEIAYTNMISGDYDFVQFGNNFIDELGTIKRVMRYNGNHLLLQSGVEICDNILYWNINFTVWNKIFKKEIFIKYNIWQPENTVHQDFIIFNYLAISKKCLIINKVLYNYLQRSGSTDNSFEQKHIDCYDTLFSIVSEFLIKNNLMLSYKRHFYTMCINLFMWAYDRIKRCSSPTYIENNIILLRKEIKRLSDTGLLPKEEISKRINPEEEFVQKLLPDFISK